MRNLKVLIKLNFKVRRRTVLVCSHKLNNKFTLCNAYVQKQSLCKNRVLARKYTCQTIPAGSFFLFKQKVQANKSCLHIYTLCAIKARTRTIKEWTKQNFCIKNQNSFKVKSLQKLNASTASPNKYTIRFLFIFLNVLPPIPTFLRDLPNVNQENELNQMGAWFNELCGDEKISLMSAQNFARMAETSVPLICSQTDFCKRRLGLNNLLNDRVLTLRSFNKFFQKRDKHRMIRPLLDFKRETITMVCKDLKMPVYPDQSNKSVQYSRNRIRKQIIPSIKYFINPQVENSLFKLAELLNKEQSFLYSVLRNTSANGPL